MSPRSMRGLAIPVLALGIALFSSGCSGTSSRAETQTTQEMGTTAETGSASVEMARVAAMMSLAIEREPERLTEILQQHDMTPEAFEELLYDIAQDPELTEAYEATRSGSSP